MLGSRLRKREIDISADCYFSFPQQLPELPGRYDTHGGNAACSPQFLVAGNEQIGLASQRGAEN
jgi:hypothetical protein